jgi:hypothetical protein
MESTDKKLLDQLRDALGSSATSTTTRRRCGDLPRALRQAKPIQCGQLAKGIDVGDMTCSLYP